MTTKKKRIAKIMDSLIVANICLLLLPLLRGNNDKEEKSPVTYVANAPQRTSFSEFLATKTTISVQQTTNPEKTYFYGNYLFINEISKGILFINNNNTPANK